MNSARTLGALLIVLCLACPAFLIFPLSVSSSRFLGGDTGHPSLQWFVNAASPYWRNATLLSLFLGGVSAGLATLAAIPAVYLVAEHGRSRLRATLDAGAIATLLVPPISLAVGYFRVFGEGNMAALLLGHVTLGLAFPYFSLRLGAESLDPATIDAAKLLGASTLGTLVRVWVSSLRRYLALGFVLAFLTSWDETVLAVFLTDPQTITLPKAVWETMQRERDLTAAAINVATAPALSLLVLWLFISRYQTRRTIGASRA